MSSFQDISMNKEFILSKTMFNTQEEKEKYIEQLKLAQSFANKLESNSSNKFYINIIGSKRRHCSIDENCKNVLTYKKLVISVREILCVGMRKKRDEYTNINYNYNRNFIVDESVEFTYHYDVLTNTQYFNTHVYFASGQKGVEMGMLTAENSEYLFNKMQSMLTKIKRSIIVKKLCTHREKKNTDKLAAYDVQYYRS